VAGKDFFGPEFQRALDREIARDFMHSNSGREIEAKYEGRQQGEPEFRLRGTPGSAERMEQVMEYAKDPTLISELAWNQVGVHLQNALHQIHAFEQSDYFDGENYPQEIVDTFTSAARMLGSVGDPRLVEAFSNELGDSMFQEYLGSAVEYAANDQAMANFDVARAHAQTQIDNRQKMLETEYRQIEKRTGPDGLAAADEFARGMGETLYHPEADEDHLRASMRSTAEQASATKKGLRQMSFLQDFDREVARSHGPGSSWNDQQRAEWETDLRNASMETVNRTFGDPEDAADRAIIGMMVDDREAATGKSLFEEALDDEIKKDYAHSKPGSEHLKKLAAANAKEWRETHDEDGYPRVVEDSRGNEHGQRY
jgi:hypothetical protein